VSMLPVRIAFQDSAAGALRLDHAGLTYQGSRQVLSFTGWHSDGTPFALVTGPFDGSPIERAKKAAQDIVASHVGSPSLSSLRRTGGDGGSVQPSPSSVARAEPPPITALRSRVEMSQKGSGLARLMGGLRDVDAKADALASRLEAALGGLHAEMSTTEQIVGNVESSVNDLKSVNALYSNGSPTSGGSPGTSGS